MPGDSTRRWRWWAARLPTVLALLFVTATVAPYAPPAGPGGAGVRPVVDLAGTAPDAATSDRPDSALVPARVGWWTPTQQVGGAGATLHQLPPPAADAAPAGPVGQPAAGRDLPTYQGRAPPGPR